MDLKRTWDLGQLVVIKGTCDPGQLSGDHAVQTAGCQQQSQVMKPDITIYISIINVNMIFNTNQTAR